MLMEVFDFATQNLILMLIIDNKFTSYVYNVVE